MNPLLLAPVLEIGSKIIDRLFPDQEKRAAAELDLLKLAQSGDLQTTLAQLEINAREASHPSLFVAGGRPFFLWIGGVGFAYAVILHPLFVWVARIKGWPEPPLPDVDLLWVVVSGLLGISSLRSIEKVKGAAK